MIGSIDGYIILLMTEKKKANMNILSSLSQYSSLLTICGSLVLGGIGAYISSKIEKNNLEHKIENIETRIKTQELLASQIDSDKNSIVLLKKEMIDIQNDMSHVKNEMLKEVSTRLNNIEKQIAAMTAILERMERRTNQKD